EERGWFDFAAVAGSIHDKLVRRHPHVFGGKSAGDESELARSWEEQKARERAEAASRDEKADAGALADVPRALPALVRAGKLGRRFRDMEALAQARELPLSGLSTEDWEGLWLEAKDRERR